MNLTRLDSFVYRSSAASLNNCLHALVSPCDSPGSLVAGISLAPESRIGSRVAAKIALEGFIEGVFEFFDKDKKKDPVFEAQQLDFEFGTGRDLSLKALEHAFLHANREVYEFGHKLSAGGELRSALISFMIKDGSAAAAKVGRGRAYLIRGGDASPFFMENTQEVERGQEKLLGKCQQVEVELAAVSIEANDIIVFFPEIASTFPQQRLCRIINECRWESTDPAADFGKTLLAAGVDLMSLMVVKVGPRTIYLSKVLE